MFSRTGIIHHDYSRFYQITRSLVPGGIAATAWLASRCKVVKWLMILEGKGTEGMALVECRVALCDLLRERLIV
ncbi:hypothetical protein CC2G_009988 [Coprinopsis cinerea AmutBmut pab1-1]|nr:hypothetical protein CC2G_009988 [Coprinopsis cinerea AmutBmut pab1-1]